MFQRPKKSFAKILATVDDHRKIILLQRVENVPKTFFREKWARRNSDVI